MLGASTIYYLDNQNTDHTHGEPISHLWLDLEITRECTTWYISIINYLQDLCHTTLTKNKKYKIIRYMKCMNGCKK